MHCKHCGQVITLNGGYWMNPAWVVPMQCNESFNGKHEPTEIDVATLGMILYAKSCELLAARQLWFPSWDALSDDDKAYWQALADNFGAYLNGTV